MPAVTITASPEEVATFRFGLIAPVIQGTFSDASEAAYYHRIAQEAVPLPGGGTYQFSPDTLERWTAHYRKSGMDGLMPKSRKDKGTSRVIDDEAGDEVARYLGEFPHASGVAIHDHLVRNSLIPATVSVRAVQRYLKEQNLHTPHECPPRVRRAFEAATFGKI